MSRDYENAYAEIQDKLAEFSTYGLFIDFKLGDLHFNTNTNSGYIMSLENQKSGCGQANTFKLAIAYVPDPELNDVMDSSFIEFGTALASEDAVFSYGYVFADGTILSSPVYNGRILDYDIEIQGSSILYTISGYSNIATIKDKKITKTTKELLKLAGGSYNPIALVIGLFREAIADEGKDYEVVDETGDYEVVENQELFSEVSDQYLFEYIRTLLASARWVEQKDQVDDGDTESTDELVTYDFIIEDITQSSTNTSTPKVRIVAINPNEIAEDTIDYTFDWMSGRSTDVVINFKPEFSGAVAIAQAQKILNSIDEKAKEIVNSKTNLTDEEKEEELKKYTVDNEGNVQEVLSSLYTVNFSGTAGGSANADVLSAIGMNAFYGQMVYNASMTTVGITDDIPILTHCYVTPLIYGKPHHTMGEYYITKMTDSINGQGYTTAFEMCKVGGSKEFKEKIKGTYLAEYKQELYAKYGKRRGSIIFKETLQAFENVSTINVSTTTTK